MSHAATLRPRVPNLDLDAEDLPLRWFDGNAASSLGVHALGAVFPEGERFFIRSVQRYAHRVGDSELREQIRLFALQEANHGRAHDLAIRGLESHGFEVESWLDWYTRVAYGAQGIEGRVGPELRLSTTAALEHLTASLGHLVLEERLLDSAHPTMRDLLYWHAAEEIEHKAVAYDVLQRVNPSWLLRVGGMAMGLGCLVYFWWSLSRHLEAQEAAPSREEMAQSRRALRKAGLGRTERALVRFALGYLRPGFHPNSVDDRALAKQAIEALAGRFAAA